MKVGKSTYELLQPIVDAIGKTFTISAITANGSDSYTIESCNTLWATKGFSVTINTKSYLITAINPNVSITVYGTDTLDTTTTSFQLYPPIFYHGTIKATEQELNREVNNRLMETDKLPMIWLHEAVDETHFPNDENPIARESRCELYFMSPAEFEEWTNDNHYAYAIKPMRNLIDAFWTAITRSRRIEYDAIEQLEVKDFARWGTYLDGKGSEKVIFSSYNMSGCKLEITLPFIRNQLNCC